MDKIDTQGMSGPTQKGKWITNEYPVDPETGETIYPPMQVPKRTLLTDMLKEELKELINEVLDEREYKRKLEGPYDVGYDGD